MGGGGVRLTKLDRSLSLIGKVQKAAEKTISAAGTSRSTPCCDHGALIAIAQRPKLGHVFEGLLQDLCAAAQLRVALVCGTEARHELRGHHQPCSALELRRREYHQLGRLVGVNVHVRHQQIERPLCEQRSVFERLLQPRAQMQYDVGLRDKQCSWVDSHHTRGPCMCQELRPA